MFSIIQIEQYEMMSRKFVINLRIKAKFKVNGTAPSKFYSQDIKWNFQKGLDKYLKATNNKKAKIVACFDVETLDNDE
ncbi:hypothetical protein BpHYR1_021017, partial [Brachionus plicatilis]